DYGDINLVYKRSTDNGSNWTFQGLPGSRVIDVFTYQDNVFAGTNYDGVFRSTDGGTSWLQVNGGLANRTVTALLVNQAGFVFAGTFGNGVFKSTATVTDVENVTTIIPEEIRLFDNYPNPFNPVTTIKFSLPVEANTKLSVFDITGKEVSILINNKLTPGIYEFQWDASEFSSGTYFSRLETDNVTQVKKMTFVK
ncbi:MAG: T9SS type A sorting domain-containing protein, partial [bacterium]